MSDPDKWGIDLTPDEADTFMAAICEARRGPDLPDPLVALRAEVEELREKAWDDFYDDGQMCDQNAENRSLGRARMAPDGRVGGQPMTSDRDQLAELIGAVLQGIDQTEIPDDGWWETSGGADFGARKKDELIDAILAAGWRKTARWPLW